MIFKEYSVDETGYNNHYIVTLYDDDTLYLVFIDHDGCFEINNTPYNVSDIRYHSLAVLTNI